MNIEHQTNTGNITNLVTGRIYGWPWNSSGNLPRSLTSGRNCRAINSLRQSSVNNFPSMDLDVVLGIDWRKPSGQRFIPRLQICTHSARFQNHRGSRDITVMPSFNRHIFNKASSKTVVGSVLLTRIGGLENMILGDSGDKTHR